MTSQCSSVSSSSSSLAIRFASSRVHSNGAQGKSGSVAGSCINLLISVETFSMIVSSRVFVDILKIGQALPGFKATQATQRMVALPSGQGFDREGFGGK